MLAAAGLGSAAADESVDAQAGIRIGLPATGDRRVAVAPGAERVVLELPEGADYPADFVAASGGLLRAAAVDELDGAADRVRVDLELAAAYLDRVEVEPDAVVLLFRSRFTDAVGTEGERYEVGPEDKLHVTIQGQPDLGASLVVAHDGSITAPLVGDMRVAGLSPREIAARLTERLDRTYLVDPRVDVEVEEYRSQWVVVSGEVRKPGRVPLRGGTRLKEVLGEAQGITEFGGEEITVSHRVEGSDETKTLRIARVDFEAGRSNPRLSNGDIVEVPRAERCYVHGEVRESGPVRVERGMTLLRALALAGGVSDWANRKAITIRHEDGTQHVYDLNRIEAGRDADPPLRGGDVVIVKRRFL